MIPGVHIAPEVLVGLNIDSAEHQLFKSRLDQMKTEKERPLVVTVDKAGKVYVGLEDTPVELKDLAPMLKALAENNLEKRVYVRADEAVNYGAVVTVLALLQSSGFTNAGLPVDPNSAKRILQEK